MKTFLQLGVGLISAVAWGGSTLTLPAPCAPDGTSQSQTYLRSCSDVLQGNPGVNGYMGPTGVIPLYDQQTKAEAAKGISPATVTCDVVGNSLHNPQPEILTNSQGQSCGTPVNLNVQASSSGVKTWMTNAGQYGTTESAYLSGTWVQALSCHWMEVRNEILNNHYLKNLAPECQAMSQAYQNLMSQSTTVASRVTNLAQQANISNIWSCAAQAGSDALQQSAQQLCSGRASIEALFTQVAYCEASYRAEKAYRSLAPDPTSFMETLKTKMMKTCNSQCSSRCSGCTSPIIGAAERCSKCGTQCANGCYQQNLVQFYTNELAPLPSNGNCSL